MTEPDDAREQAALDLEHGIAQIYQRSRARARHFADQFDGDLQPLAVGILRYIIINGPLRAGDIVTGLGIDKAAVSRQLAQLKQLGLIDSTPDAADKRATLIEASDTARAALAAFRAEVSLEYRTALASWPTDEIAQLAGLLHRFNESVDRPE